MSLLHRMLPGLLWRAEDGEGTASPPIKDKSWLAPEEAALVPPRDLWIGPDDSISHYYRWIWEYLSYLTLIAGLKREQDVLELGCGHGRLCRGLLGYLRSPGSYTGLDIDLARIVDAQNRIQTPYPNFQFVCANVRSKMYNPDGKIDAAQFKFPFPDESFDVIFAGSLFTHLLPAETRNYFAESRRVLKPGGRCLYSFFLLDNYRGSGSSISPHYEFPHTWTEPGVAVRDPAHPDAIIGYGSDNLRAYAEEAGLHYERAYPGYWTESPGWAVNEQDLVLLAK